MKPSNVPINVVCAIIERNGKFLAAKRSNTQSHPGFWEFPGGKIDPSETGEQAILREIKEELGIEIAIREALPSVTYTYPGKTIALHPFVCTIQSGNPKALEHEEIIWVDNTTYSNLNWLPADISVLANYKKSL
jgi:8-oxo-dGTP diphosphatase